jgi:hypothetical protein
MAKRPKARKKAVPSLKAAVTKSLKSARALRGKVAERADLDATIKGLEYLQAQAAKGCGTGTWARKFTLAAAKPARKSAKKR